MKKRGRPKFFTEEQQREKRRIKTAKWRLNNLEKYRQIVRDSMKRTNDAKAREKGWVPGILGRRAKPITLEEKRAKHNARVKRYYAENIEKTRPYGAVLARNRRAKVRSVGGKHTAADVAELLRKQKGKCAWCLLSLGEDKYHVDHYVPIALGGSNDRSNLRILHSRCNLAKSKKHPADFAQQNGLLCW